MRNDSAERREPSVPIGPSLHLVRMASLKRSAVRRYTESAKRGTPCARLASAEPCPGVRCQPVPR